MIGDVQGPFEGADPPEAEDLHGEPHDVVDADGDQAGTGDGTEQEPEPVGASTGDGSQGGRDHGTDALQGAQQAAHQMISAARGLLDALEALVDDPATVRDAVTVVGGLARDAARMAADAGRHAAHGHAPADGAATDPTGEDPPDDGPVQRISVR